MQNATRLREEGSWRVGLWGRATLPFVALAALSGAACGGSAFFIDGANRQGADASTEPSDLGDATTDRGDSGTIDSDAMHDASVGDASPISVDATAHDGNADTGLATDAATCFGADGGLTDSFKKCGAPSDCITATRPACCGAQYIIGINKATSAAYSACTAIQCPPGLGCAFGPWTTEDGLAGDPTNALVTCNNGQCRTSRP